MSSESPAIGFACRWDKIPERTWSYTPWNLRAGMQQAGNVIDVGVQIPAGPRNLLRAAHIRRYRGRLTTSWNYSRLTDLYTTRSLRRELGRAAAGGGCDAVLTIQDLAAVPVPFFMYQDLSYDALIAARAGTDALADLLSITPDAVRRRRERQLGLYQQATGIIAMSHWFARSLTELTGLPSAKVHVVHPGVSAGHSLDRGGPSSPAANGGHISRPRETPRRKLLFVGNDFERKGGDLAVAALARLRRDHDPQLTLTIAGPKAWPLRDAPPDGVRFLGSLPPAEVGHLYDDHDLFVMPSRMEPFGIVFAEAISRGLPCIGRNAYAMPEVITPGLSGFLVESDDIDDLCAVIAGALTDDDMYAACSAHAPQAAAYFSWQRAGREVVDKITQLLQA